MFSTTVLDQAVLDAQLKALFTPATASGSIATFSNGGDDIPVSEFECDIVAQQASGTPTPVSPLPITGFSQADITNAKKYIRVTDTNPQTYSQNGIDITTYANGKITINGTTTANITITINVNPFTVFADNSRTVNINNDFVNANANIQFCNGSTTIDTWTFTSLNRTYTNFTALSGKYIDNIKIYVASGQTINNGSLMNEFIVMDTATTYTVAFGQTIYGGRLIYANGQWSIEATFGGVDDLGDLSWIKGSKSFYADITGAKLYEQSVIPNMLCEVYRTVSYNDLVSEQYNEVCSINNNSSIILMRDTNYATASNFATAVTGKKAIFELATPVIIPITSSTRVKTISGENNIYSNTGDCELKYFTNKADSIAELIKAFVL